LIIFLELLCEDSDFLNSDFLISVGSKLLIGLSTNGMVELFHEVLVEIFIRVETVFIICIWDESDESKGSCL